MKQYIQVIKNTWAETMEYRLNFVLWRVRMIIRLLVLYFLWQAIFTGRGEVFGYQQAQILTYVLISQVLGTIILATRTYDVGSDIHQGNLTNYLIKPINYFAYVASRDIADKFLNVSFSLVEFALLVLLLRPTLIWQTNVGQLILVGLGTIVGASLFFCISLLLSFMGFWTHETWAARFVFIFINEFLSGGLFPIDILPAGVYRVLSFLPFPYLMFFPLKLYLGQLSGLEVIQGFSIALLWLVILSHSLQTVWRAGLRVYTAEGR